MREWNLSPVEGGLIGSYGFFGMMLGAICFGVLADWFGRRNVLVVSVFLFSVFMFLCAFATGPVSFSLFRFVGGVGIGGIMPNVLALLTDYAPTRLRNTMTGIVLCCFSLGSILAPALALLMLPGLGWRSLYWVAILPVPFLPFMVRHFRESPAVLLARGRTDELRALLARVNPDAAIALDAELEVGTRQSPGGLPLAELFRNRRALATIMIGVAFFMCLLMINGLTIWLPGFMVGAGYALGSGLPFLIILNVGAVAGTLVLGRLADRWGTKRVLIPMFVVSAVALSLLGFADGFAILAVLVFVAGACTTGSQNIAYSFVSQYYRPSMRATGIGLASAVGRVGAIVGPTYGGILLSLSLPAELNFVSFAVPGVIAALAFWFVRAGATPGQEVSEPLPAVADSRGAS
ncbi:aromatic acid/H+ symport family MFS transporter [Nonomuraea sp. PA05]|nr:aromatic acid/H+ symport family MFS transporter [Nonomuraea sp. PA05]